MCSSLTLREWGFFPHFVFVVVVWFRRVLFYLKLSEAKKRRINVTLWDVYINEHYVYSWVSLIQDVRILVAWKIIITYTIDFFSLSRKRLKACIYWYFLNDRPIVCACVSVCEKERETATTTIITNANSVSLHFVLCCVFFRSFLYSIYRCVFFHYFLWWSLSWMNDFFSLCYCCLSELVSVVRCSKKKTV